MDNIKKDLNNEQFRVGMMTWSMDEMKTGIPYYIYELIQEFKKENHSSNLYLYHWSGRGAESIYENTHEIALKSLPCRISSFSNLPFAIKKSKIDILHLPVPTLNQIIPAFLNRNTKQVMTVHDVAPHLFPEMYTKKAVYSFDLSIKISKKIVNQYIVISKNTKNDLIKYYGIPEELISVIYLGKNSHFFPAKNKAEIRSNLAKKLNLPIEEPYILSVGTLEPRKNIPGLLKAYSWLKKDGLKTKMVIVGMKGWKYNPIFDLIKTLDLENDVIFPGYVTDEDIQSFYQGAEIFVFPSFYEGFGFPPLEAMACGIPVVVSNSSSIPEVVGKAGIQINPNSTTELASAMESLLKSKERQIYFSEEGIKQAALFSWEKTAEETWKVYEKLAREK